MAELRHRVPARTVGALASWLLRGYHLSWRRDDGEVLRLDEVIASGERIFVVFWHSKYIPLFSLLSGRAACVFASESFRGKVIAEISRRFGYDCTLLPTVAARGRWISCEKPSSSIRRGQSR